MAVGVLTLTAGVALAPGTAMALPAPAPGNINTVAGAAGGGQGTVAGAPQAVAVWEGKIYVADTLGGVVDVLDPLTGQETVVAGGGSGAANGTPATSAGLSRPVGVALDASGDLFIANQGNSTVQEVPVTNGTHFGISMTAGDIYTVAGIDGAFRYSGDGGPGFRAELDQPLGVAVDATGDLFIADSGNNRVREVPASQQTHFGISMTAGYIYTVAGDGTPGASGDNRPATAAQISDPMGVAVDSNGDLFIADSSNNRVQEVPVNSGTYFGQTMTAGDIYTVAGGAPGRGGDGAPSAQLGGPAGVSVDFAGNLFIADTRNNLIQEVPANTGTYFGQTMTAGDIYTVAGDGAAGFTGDSVPATASALNGPDGVAVDPAGDLVIADSANNRVREVPVNSGTYFGQPMAALDIYTVYGPGVVFAGDGGSATAARFNGLAGVAVDAAGDLFIDDSGGVAGGSDSRVLDVPATSSTEFGIPMTAGDIYTVAGNGLQGFSGDGGPSTQAEISSNGIAVDASGNLFIADNSNRVREVPAIPGSHFGITMTVGDIYTVAGNGTQGFSGDGGPSTSAGLAGVAGVAVDGAGDLFIADRSGRIREVPAASGTQFGIPMSAGNIYTVAGNGTQGFSGDDGPSTSAALDGPIGVAADATGDVFIDDGSTRVREVPTASGTQFGIAMAAGHIYTVAGDGTLGFTGDGGPAVSAELDDLSIAVDSGGDLVLADVKSDQVQEVAAASGPHFGIAMTAGAIYSVAGNGIIGFSGDGGPAISAELAQPGPLAMDTGGDLFIADRGNYRVREVAADSRANPAPAPIPKPNPIPVANPNPNPTPIPKAPPHASLVPQPAPAPSPNPAPVPNPPSPPAVNPVPVPVPAANPVPAPVANPVPTPAVIPGAASVGEDAVAPAEDYSMVGYSPGGLPTLPLVAGTGFVMLVAGTVGMSWKNRRHSACPAWAGCLGSKDPDWQRKVGRWRR